MQTAALIVAAGMSSRMGNFKPMLSIGSITIAQRVVATFHQAGIQKIVMVTGFNAVTLERHLSGSGVIILRNDDYENTQMFDSVRIGLTYLRDKCDRCSLPRWTFLCSRQKPSAPCWIPGRSWPARQSPGDLGVVAHGGVIALFLESLTGRRYKPNYCGIVTLNWDERGFFHQEESSCGKC